MAPVTMPGGTMSGGTMSGGMSTFSSSSSSSSSHSEAEAGAELRVTVCEAISSSASSSSTAVQAWLASSDSDGDGMISETEMSGIYVKSGVTLSLTQQHEAFVSFDTAGAGKVQISAMQTTIEQTLVMVDEYRVKVTAGLESCAKGQGKTVDTLMSAADADHDGQMSEPELASVYKSCDIQVTEEQARILFASYSLTGSATVSVGTMSREVTQSETVTQHSVTQTEVRTSEQKVTVPAGAAAIVVGGTTESTTPTPFNCETGFISSDQWSQAQKDWCCEHEQAGCPPGAASTTAGPVTTALPWNCEGGFVPISSWSAEQITWCCINKQIGCPPTTTGPPSPTPTPAATTTPLQGCDAPCTLAGAQDTCRVQMARHAAGEFKEQAQPCAISQQWVIKQCPACKACPPCTDATPTPQVGYDSMPFDCNAGYDNWELGWAQAQKAWCCQNTGRACASAPGAAGMTQVSATRYGRLFLQPAGIMTNFGAFQVMMICASAGTAGLLILIAGSRGWSITNLARRASAGVYPADAEVHEALVPNTESCRELSPCQGLSPSRWRQRSSTYQALTEEAAGPAEDLE